MTGPFRDTTAGLEAHIEERRRDLAQLQVEKQAAVTRHQLARATLERTFREQRAAPGPVPVEPLPFNKRSFLIGALWGSLLGLFVSTTVFLGRSRPHDPAVHEITR